MTVETEHLSKSRISSVIFWPELNFHFSLIKQKHVCFAALLLKRPPFIHPFKHIAVDNHNWIQNLIRYRDTGAKPLNSQMRVPGGRVGDPCGSAWHNSKMWRTTILSSPPTSQRAGVRCSASIHFVSHCGVRRELSHAPSSEGKEGNLWIHVADRSLEIRTTSVLSWCPTINPWIWRILTGRMALFLAPT